LDNAASGKPRRDQIAYQQVLAVHHHVLAGEAMEVDAVVLGVEAQDDTFMPEAGCSHRTADPGFEQELLDDVFQYAGANAVFNVIARAGLQDDGLDPAEVEEVREQQASRASTDDADLRSAAHGTLLVRSEPALYRPCAHPQQVMNRRHKVSPRASLGLDPEAGHAGELITSCRKQRIVVPKHEAHVGE
jgi:hypothetical protein